MFNQLKKELKMKKVVKKTAKAETNKVEAKKTIKVQEPKAETKVKKVKKGEGEPKTEEKEAKKPIPINTPKFDFKAKYEKAEGKEEPKDKKVKKVKEATEKAEPKEERALKYIYPADLTNTFDRKKFRTKIRNRKENLESKMDKIKDHKSKEYLELKEIYNKEVGCYLQ